MSEQLNYSINVTGNASESVGSLKKQLREAQNEVVNLSAKFGATSKEAINAAKRAAELKDAIGDARALTEAFNPDQKFNALSKVLQGVAGGFAAVQGAIGLFGNESKELEKQLLKVQSALAFSQGIEQLGNAKDSFIQLGGVIKDRVVTAFSTLRGAIVATGIGALVVGLGLLIANFDKVKKAVLNLVPGLGAVADFIGNLVNKVTDFIGITSEAGRATAKLIADNDKAIKDSERNLELNGDKYDEYTRRKIEANNEFKKKQNEFLKDEQLTDEQRNRFIVQAREKANREIVKADKDRNDALEKANKDAFEKSKALREKQNAEEAARQQAKNDAESKAQQIQIDAFRSTLDKRQQDLLSAEDEFEKKKGDLIRAGVTDFTKVEKEYRLKVLEINKNYDKIEEDDAAKKKEKELAAQEVDNERKFQTRKLEADTTLEVKQLELETLEADYKLKYDLAVKNGEDLVALNAYYAARKNEINKNFAEEEKKVDEDLKNAKEAAILSGLNLLGAAAGENEKIANIIFGIQKALEIGKIITSTAGAVTAVTTSTAAIPPVLPPGIPNPSFIYANALAAKKIATLKLNAAAQIGAIAGATISKFKGASGSGSFGGSAPSGSAAPLPPQRPETATTNLSAQTINAIGNQAIRAYVVETDITSNQKRVQAIKQRARFS